MRQESITVRGVLAEDIPLLSDTILESNFYSLKLSEGAVRGHPLVLPLHFLTELAKKQRIFIATRTVKKEERNAGCLVFMTKSEAKENLILAGALKRIKTLNIPNSIILTITTIPKKDFGKNIGARKALVKYFLKSILEENKYKNIIVPIFNTHDGGFYKKLGFIDIAGTVPETHVHMGLMVKEIKPKETMKTKKK